MVRVVGREEAGWYLRRKAFCKPLNLKKNLPLTKKMQLVR